MSLRFILLQHLFHLSVKTRTVIFKLSCQILMYGTLADAEMRGGGAHGVSGIDHIYCKLFTALSPSVGKHEVPSHGLDFAINI